MKFLSEKFRDLRLEYHKNSDHSNKNIHDILNDPFYKNEYGFLYEYAKEYGIPCKDGYLVDNYIFYYKDDEYGYRQCDINDLDIHESKYNFINDILSDAMNSVYTLHYHSDLICDFLEDEENRTKLKHDYDRWVSHIAHIETVLALDIEVGKHGFESDISKLTDSQIRNRLLMIKYKNSRDEEYDIDYVDKFKEELAKRSAC